jgi:mono/diheme cytochrome c family protein
MLRFSATTVALLASGAIALAAFDTSKLPPPAGAFDFDKDIRPLLELHCVECHGADKQKGKFRLDARDFLLKGGENGWDVVPGRSADSPLIHAVARLDDDLAMPPKKENALTLAQVALLRAWIDAGANYPEGFVIRSTVREGIRLDSEELAKLPPAAERKVDFVKDVQPIFAKSCSQCHGATRQEAAFRLDHKATVLTGGELGRALIPGKSAESLLIHFVAGLRPEGRMPKKGDPLKPEQIGILRAWIDQGAEFPDAASVVLQDKGNHWAFKAPVTTSLARCQNGWGAG